jgi:hypothetical protein
MESGKIVADKQLLKLEDGTTYYYNVTNTILTNSLGTNPVNLQEYRISHPAVGTIILHRTLEGNWYLQEGENEGVDAALLHHLKLKIESL